MCSSLPYSRYSGHAEASWSRRADMDGRQCCIGSAGQSQSMTAFVLGHHIRGGIRPSRSGSCGNEGKDSSLFDGEAGVRHKYM
jgi:hypothetical protein